MAEEAAAVEMDMLTKRPRTPNDQYTVLTEEQLANIKKTSFSNPFFLFQKPSNFTSDFHSKRFFKDRYAFNTSQYLFRGQPGSNPVCWIGDQWQRAPPEQHNTSRLGASLPWGIEKQGGRTYSHFDGEDPYRYLTIDCYRRHPTNVIGRTVHKFGRPGESYYHQRNPSETTWFGSSHKLNQTDVLQDIRPKTTLEHQMKWQGEKMRTFERNKSWPIYSEYTDKFTMGSSTLPYITPAAPQKHKELA